jgi:hypothetical protein
MVKQGGFDSTAGRASMYACHASIAGAAMRFASSALAWRGGDAVALLLARVYALVDHRLQPARFVAGGAQRPHSGVANGHADSLPVQLGFKDERLGASGHANGQPRRVGVPGEGLPAPRAGAGGGFGRASSVRGSCVGSGFGYMGDSV